MFIDQIYYKSKIYVNPVEEKSAIFPIKLPTYMILVVEDSHYPPLSIDTKGVPVALYLTSQWRFNDVRITKNWVFTENRLIFQIFAKNPGKIWFWLGLLLIMKERTIRTYAGNFKYITAT